MWSLATVAIFLLITWAIGATKYTIFPLKIVFGFQNWNTTFDNFEISNPSKGKIRLSPKNAWFFCRFVKASNIFSNMRRQTRIKYFIFLNQMPQFQGTHAISCSYFQTKILTNNFDTIPCDHCTYLELFEKFRWWWLNWCNNVLLLYRTLILIILNDRILKYS